MTRTFEFNDEKTNKFWEIEMIGNEFTVTFGKVGTSGQSQTKTFADEAECLKQAEKLIREKVRKGYVEQRTRTKVEQPQITSYSRYDQTDSRGFLSAIRTGKLDIVRQYIAAGANPAHTIRATKRSKVAPIEEALLRKRYDVLKELIAHANSYNTSAGSEDAGTAISVLVYLTISEEDNIKYNRVGWIEKLLENGYDIAKDTHSILVYYSRMRIADEALLKRLLQHVDLKQDKGDFLYSNIIKGVQNVRGMEIQRKFADEIGEPWVDPEIDVVKRVIDLLDLGVQINPSDETKKHLVQSYGSPIHAALTFYGTRYDLIKKMIEKGADLSIRNSRQIVISGDATRNIPQSYTPLQLALSGTIEVSDEVIELLKQHSPKDPNEELLKEGTPEKKLITLSMVSPQERDIKKEILSLLKEKFDVNAVDYKGKTALHHLVVHDWFTVLLEMFPDLLQAGVDVNARDKEGRTPIFYIQTSMRGIEALYQTLIKAGANINDRDNSGYTPAIYAITQTEDRDLINDILISHLKCGADPKLTTNDGNTLLHHYMLYFDSNFEFDDLLKALIIKGADINAKNNKGETPLHLASVSENRYADDIVEELISQGADINAQDNEGNTPLHLATKEDIVTSLLAGLPDVSIKNNAGITTYDHVKTQKYDNSDIDDALEALIAAPSGTREMPELKWTSHTVNLNADAPTELEITSAMLIPENEGDMFLHYVGDNLLAVGGDNENTMNRVSIIDLLTGQVLWEKSRYNYYSNDCPPLYDGDTLYMPLWQYGTSSLYACNRRTGEEVWTCKTGNSYGQYSKWIKQDEKYIFNINRDTQKLYLIDKGKGKMKAIKLAHPVLESRHDVMSWNNKIIVIGTDKKKDRFVLDLYDPVKLEFIATIGELGDYAPIAYYPKDKYLYVLNNNLCMVKVNLETGEVESEKEGIPGYDDNEAYIKGYNDTIEWRKDGKFHFRATLIDADSYYCVYDPATEEFNITPVQPAEQDVSASSNTDDIFVEYENELAFMKVYLHYGAGEKRITEYIMPNYGGDSRIIDAMILGDAVYVLQQGGNKYGDESCVLYRLNGTPLQ